MYRHTSDRNSDDSDAQIESKPIKSKLRSHQIYFGSELRKELR